MLHMSPAAIAALQDSIDKISHLSYRIREWEYFENYLHNVENSFKPFLVRVQLIEAGELTMQDPALLDWWTYCQDTHIVELNGFVRQLQHIHLPFRPDDTNYPDLKESISSLIITGTNIQYALAHGLQDDLKKQVEAFNGSLQGQIVNPRIMKQHELDQLCEVTYRLDIQVNQDFDEIKEILAQLVQSLHEISNRLRQLKDQLAKARVRVPEHSDLLLTGVERFIDQTLNNLSTTILPQFADTKVPPLQESISKLANLAYRIREWEHLQGYLRNVEKSFSPFWSALQHIEAPYDWAAQVPTLKVLWGPYHEVYLPELNGFAQNLKYIHKPFEYDTAASYPDLRDGIAGQVDIGRNIYEALINASFKEVRDLSYRFQSALTGQLTSRRTTMNQELEHMCQLVHELSSQITNINQAEAQTI